MAVGYAEYGGGGGSIAIKYLDVSSITSITYTIGAAGAYQGNAGTSSFVLSQLTPAQTDVNAQGGYTGGSGGNATGGDINITGESGSMYTGARGSDTETSSGRGGGGLYGWNGKQNHAGDGNGFVPQANTGGGGFGGSYASSGVAHAGSAGASGIIIVEEYA
jgi:hypothetical protein